MFGRQAPAFGLHPTLRMDRGRRKNVSGAHSCRKEVLLSAAMGGCELPNAPVRSEV